MTNELTKIVFSLRADSGHAFILPAMRENMLKAANILERVGELVGDEHDEQQRQAHTSY